MVLPAHQYSIRPVVSVSPLVFFDFWTAVLLQYKYYWYFVLVLIPLVVLVLTVLVLLLVEVLYW
jgi:hypothetical protein